MPRISEGHMVTQWIRDTKKNRRWLEQEKKRIEETTEGRCLCEIRSRGNKGLATDKIVLVYTNGHMGYKDGAHVQWIPNEEGER